MKALRNAEVHHDFLASAVKEAKAIRQRKIAAFQAQEEGIFPKEKKVVLNNLTRVSSYPFQSAASRCLKEGSTSNHKDCVAQ